MTEMTQLECKLGKLKKLTPYKQLAVGGSFPSIKLLSTNKDTIDIAETAIHKNIVVFFYPGDKEGLRYPELMGCTPQACSFRDSIEAFTRLYTVVYGVSFQSPQRQQEFIERQHLSFRILSDAQKELAKAIGLPYWQSEAGEEYPCRQTYVIKKGNKVVKIFNAIDPEHHIPEVLNVMEELKGES